MNSIPDGKIHVGDHCIVLLDGVKRKKALSINIRSTAFRTRGVNHPDARSLRVASSICIFVGVKKALFFGFAMDCNREIVGIGRS